MCTWHRWGAGFKLRQFVIKGRVSASALPGVPNAFRVFLESARTLLKPCSVALLCNATNGRNREDAAQDTRP
jgi:hypothetical protein